MKGHKVWKTVDIAAWAVLVLAGLNLGMVGAFGVDMIAAIFGSMTAATRIIYIAAGLAAVYEIVGVKAIAYRWRLDFDAAPGRPLTGTGI
jgi:uncharacterized membrane protein YuzA (DUF378 family)